MFTTNYHYMYQYYHDQCYIIIAMFMGSQSASPNLFFWSFPTFLRPNPWLYICSTIISTITSNYHYQYSVYVQYCDWTGGNETSRGLAALFPLEPKHRHAQDCLRKTWYTLRTALQAKQQKMPGM